MKSIYFEIGKSEIASNSDIIGNKFRMYFLFLYKFSPLLRSDVWRQNSLKIRIVIHIFITKM